MKRRHSGRRRFVSPRNNFWALKQQRRAKKRQEAQNGQN